MKEKYIKIKKEIALRAGFDSALRSEDGEGNLLLSEKDIRMISLTVEEKIAAMGGSEYAGEAPAQKNKKQIKIRKNGKSSI
jgi:hypothetical protein